MEAAGICSCWPHPLQLWKLLTSKEWMSQMCVCPQFQIPLTTSLSKALVLRDASKAAIMAVQALRSLKKDRDETGLLEQVVVKLGYSYEGIDVKMVSCEQLAEALYFLLTQPNYNNGTVYVQERINVSLEARCFLINGRLEKVLYTRFARIDVQGYVREYEKESCGLRAMRDWFMNDEEAWKDAMKQIQQLCDRWTLWLLAQSAEPTVSLRILLLDELGFFAPVLEWCIHESTVFFDGVYPIYQYPGISPDFRMQFLWTFAASKSPNRREPRIDYLLEHVSVGRARVWTGELGELGYPWRR